MGGSIDVSSEPGKGSVFGFTARFAQQAASVRRLGNDIGDRAPPRTQLARAVAGVETAGDATEMIVDEPRAAGPTDRPTALIVEDNAINLMVAVGILETLGWKVETAADGLEGLAAYESRRFDVIFMDCQMPRMDGFEATAAIRAREAAGNPKTPIIALTASADDGYRTRCLNAGMDEFVSKPFTRAHIEAAIAAVL